MAKLTWAKKLNNRLKRNWNIEIDFSKCFRAKACGKRDRYDHSSELPFNDNKWERVYNTLLPANKKDKISIEYKTDYQWDLDSYEYLYALETEYYGYCYGYVIIRVETPTGRNKININTLYV